MAQIMQQRVHVHIREVRQFTDKFCKLIELAGIPSEIGRAENARRKEMQDMTQQGVHDRALLA